MYRKYCHHCSLLKVELPTLCLFIFLLLLCFSTTSAIENEENSSQVLLLLGHDGSAWYPYTATVSPKKELQHKHWQKIDSIINPASVTRQPFTGILFVKDNSSKLKRFSKSGQLLSTLTESMEAGKSKSYTQLRAYDDGLVMVELLQGKSRETRLVRYTENARGSNEKGQINPDPLLQQAAGQFNPLIAKDIQSKGEALFYGHVSCRLACKPVIQEIWRLNLTTRLAKQMTMLNATSYLHSVDESGRYGFLSSNYHGNYHLARLDLKNNELIWLTDGQITDSYPAVVENGDLYFIRRTPDGTSLMRLGDVINANNSVVKALPATIALPEGVEKIRYLEMSAQ